MIEIKNWRVRVPPDEYQIGYNGENLVHKLDFLLPDTEYADWMFKLDIKQGGKKDVLHLEMEELPEGLRLTTDVRRGLLICPGTITAQVRAFTSDGRERHTNQFYFFVRDSVRPWEAFPDPLPTEFHQMETAMTMLLENTRSAAQRAELAADRDIVRQYKTYLEFPSIGDSKILYIDAAANKSYRWDDENLKYFVVGSDYEQIKIIDGGNAHG